MRAEAAAFGETITVHPYASVAAGKADVQSGTLDALVSGSGAGTTVTVQSAVDPTLQTALNDQARQQVLTEYLTQHGLPPSDVLGQLAFSVSVNEVSLVNAAQEEQIVIGLFVAGTLYITLIMYGQFVAQGVIEEKSNRIVEILLATVRPWQLMLGKITGIGLVALVQVVIVAGVALVLASATKLVSIPTLSVDVVISGVVWFVLGYLIYALLFAAAGSMVSRQEDMTSVALPVILVLVAAWILALTVAAPDPGSTATDRLLVHPAVLAGDHAGAHRGGSGTVLAGRDQRGPRDRDHLHLCRARGAHLSQLGAAHGWPRQDGVTPSGWLPQESRSSDGSSPDSSRIEMGATAMRSRPSRLAWYMARSAAATTSSSSSPWSGKTATPIDAVTRSISDVGARNSAMRRLQRLGNAHRALDRRVGQHDEEFLAAVAHRVVAVANHATDRARNRAQHRVTGGVTGAVVDLLEVVEVHEEDADAGPGAQALGHDPRAHVPPPANVEQPGQRIGQGTSLQLAVHLGIAPRRRGDESEQRAALEVLLGEGVEAVTPDVEHTEALVTRNQRDRDQQLGLARCAGDGGRGGVRVGVGAPVRLAAPKRPAR